MTFFDQTTHRVTKFWKPVLATRSWKPWFCELRCDFSQKCHKIKSFYLAISFHVRGLRFQIAPTTFELYCLDFGFLDLRTGFLDLKMLLMSSCTWWSVPDLKVSACLLESKLIYCLLRFTTYIEVKSSSVGPLWGTHFWACPSRYSGVHG